ncbi:MAG: hypothetical protein KAT00_00400 [Planctomycetes bacterium]|nr:hypothetical protein [Planctomycetota bacterium]
MHDKEPTTHKYAEAWKIMHYVCEVCGHHEILYNGRNGVTPFMIGCGRGPERCNGSAQHDQWSKDYLSPQFRPLIGMRVFVDLTQEEFEESARRRIESYDAVLALQFIERFGSKEAGIKEIIESGFSEGAPTTIVWNGSDDQQRRLRRPDGADVELAKQPEKEQGGWPLGKATKPECPESDTCRDCIGEQQAYRDPNRRCEDHGGTPDA